MSNRFVSGGTINTSGDASEATDAIPRSQLGQNTEWEAVQRELENDRKRREEQRLKSATGEERSLYDVLQANKAAKEAAFEEQNKIKNQFRALDDDEVEFLDEVVAAKRKEEERVRRETEDGVKAFREQQRRMSGAEEGVDGGGEDWGVGRKRKRREREKGGVVRRKVDGDADEKRDDDGKKSEDKEKKVEKIEEKIVEAKGIEKEEGKQETLPVKTEKKSALVDYGSDSDD